MNVFIQEIKGRWRVRIKHGNQIFTIDDYNGYNGEEIEWLKNCVERFFEAYDKSVKQSTEQPEAIAGEKTKTEIWKEWCEKDISWTDAASGAMSEYASQQTASKDKQIEIQQAHIDDQDQLIFDQTKEITELKAAISELIQVKDWKDKHGKDEHYLKAMPIAWENARKLMHK